MIGLSEWRSEVFLNGLDLKAEYNYALPMTLLYMPFRSLQMTKKLKLTQSSFAPHYKSSLLFCSLF